MYIQPHITSMLGDKISNLIQGKEDVCTSSIYSYKKSECWIYIHKKRECCSIGNKKQSHQQKDLGQGAGDIKVAGGARKRLLVLIPPKAASSWWPTDDAPLVAAIPIFDGGFCH